MNLKKIFLCLVIAVSLCFIGLSMANIEVNKTTVTLGAKVTIKPGTTPKRVHVFLKHTHFKGSCTIEQPDEKTQLQAYMNEGDKGFLNGDDLKSGVVRYVSKGDKFKFDVTSSGDGYLGGVIHNAGNSDVVITCSLSSTK